MKVFKWTLIWALCSAIHWTIEFLQDKKVVGESLHSDAFKRILESYLKMHPKTDWLGRVYGVVNPAITLDGKVDLNSMVFEIDGINTNNDTWVENWLYKQMITVENVFGLEKSGFFDLINAETRHVGPENADNYLIIFDIASRKMMSKKWKRVLWQSILYTIIVMTILIIF